MFQIDRRAGDQVMHRLRDQHLAWFRPGGDTHANVEREAAQPGLMALALAGVYPGAGATTRAEKPGPNFARPFA